MGEEHYKIFTGEVIDASHGRDEEDVHISWNRLLTEKCFGMRVSFSLTLFRPGFFGSFQTGGADSVPPP